MTDVERREGYNGTRVLIATERVLTPQFRATLLYVTGGQLEMLRNLMMYLHRASTFVSEYHDSYYLRATVAEWDNLQAIVAELEDMLMEVVLGFYDAYVYVADQKAVGVNGGTFTIGSWRVRDINVELADTAGICSVASNQLTLEAGTYRCVISCPAYRVDGHRTRLRNVTDSTILLNGSSEYASSEELVTTRSFLVGRFVLAAQKVLEVSHRCRATRADDGFGKAFGIEGEVYTMAEFWRET